MVTPLLMPKVLLKNMFEANNAQMRLLRQHEMHDMRQDHADHALDLLKLGLLKQDASFSHLLHL